MTRVAWLTTEPLQRTPRGYTSERASLRYRVALPHAALQRLGCESSIRHFTVNAERRLLEQLKGVDVIVVGKIWYPPETLPRTVPPLMSFIEGLRSRGSRVVADFCDDYFADPRRGPFDIGLANSVDAIVASTPALADTLRRLTPAPVAVVTDPVEGSRGEPRAPRASGGPLALLWFGHANNFPPLLAGLRQLEPAASAAPFSLVIVSAPGPMKEGAVAELNRAWQGSGRSCRFREWSVRAVFDELRECDCVIIPSDPQDPAKAVKSPNRFTESVWAGRFVLAHPLPAYLPLADCGWVGEDLAAGLRWLAGHGEEALERIRRGQDLVARDYSEQAVGGAWKRALEAA